MSATGWLDRYRMALNRARARAEIAEESGELIACGLTNNVDLVVSLTDDILARLLRGSLPNPDGPRQTSASTPDELLTAIMQHVAAGEGVDIPVANADTQDWLISQVDGRPQLGGTGAQTANTLAVLGFRSLVHLTGCSPAQAAVFDQPARILVPRDEVLLPVDRLARADDETMWHVALEYPAGVSFTVSGRQFVAPAGSRVIVSYDPVNSVFRLQHGYVETVLARIAAVPAVLLSGYTQIVDPAVLAELVDATRAAARRWRAAKPGLTIHLELGAMPDRATLAGVAAAMAPEITSIGMNADELRDLATVWEIGADDTKSLLETLAALRKRLPVARLNVHTATHAASLTSGQPERERDALLFAVLVASTRARVGYFPTFADLEETLSVCVPHPGGIAVTDRFGDGNGIVQHHGAAFVIVPAFAVPSPVATVGLGDSFTAGILAMV